MRMNTYGFCRLDNADPDRPCLERLMVGGAIHGGILRHVTAAELLEEDIDLGDMFLVMATMQHKLLDVIDAARLEAKDISDLKKMFATTADSMRMFGRLLGDAGEDCQIIDDAANEAQKAFGEHLEQLLKDKKEKA